MESSRKDIWAALPNEAQLVEFFRAAEEYIAPDTAQEPPTPYHFALDVLFRLYTALQPTEGLPGTSSRENGADGVPGRAIELSF